MTASGLAFADIDRVFLTGGSSFVPAVRRIFVDRFGGAKVTGGTVVGEIESTKSVGELFAPLAGEVVEINQAIIDQPDLVNADPFGDAWMIKVRFTELPTLLTADEYAALIS